LGEGQKDDVKIPEKGGRQKNEGRGKGGSHAPGEERRPRVDESGKKEASKQKKPLHPALAERKREKSLITSRHKKGMP